MAINRLATFKKSDINTFYVLGDIHGKHMHEPSLKIALDMAKGDKSPICVLNGDLLEAEYIMFKQDSFKKWIKRGEDGLNDYFIPNAVDEFEVVNNILDRLQKVFREVIYIVGNHCKRYDYFVHKYCSDAYAHNFNISANLALTKRKIRLIDCNEWLDLNQVSITHGMWCSSNYLDKHYLACGGRTCIVSHVHRPNSKCFITRGETRAAYSTGALCTLNPDYLKNQENAWVNGFIKLVFYNGNFWVNNYSIWNNKLIHNGKIYNG